MTVINWSNKIVWFPNSSASTVYELGNQTTNKKAYDNMNYTLVYFAVFNLYNFTCKICT